MSKPTFKHSEILGQFNPDAFPLVDVRGEELRAAYERIAQCEALLRECALHWEGTDAPILSKINMLLEPFPTGVSA